MMGQQETRQGHLFYAFDLEAVVPCDHLLRGIDQFLDLSDVCDHLRAHYSHTGRPSVDPELLLRMLVVGYAFGIRSERRLCEEVRLNLAYRWFCGLGLEDGIPDHSTFSKARTGRFRDSGVFRHVFETVLSRCMSEGLVGGEGFAVDASIIPADANRQRGLTPADIASGEHDVSQDVTDYLAALDADAKPSKIVSLTDPEARWTGIKGGRAFHAYSANYLIDLRAGIVIDTETTQALKTDEVEASKIMIDRVEDRFDLHPDRLTADTAYGTGPMLSWLVDAKAITPHIPVWDKNGGTPGRLPISAFEWDEQNYRYECPGGKFLTTNGNIGSDDARTFLTRTADCRGCALKESCCPNKPQRIIRRSIHQGARGYAKSLAGTPPYKQSQHDRKKVEMSFAQLKRTLKRTRLRLRGLKNAADELMLGAIALNLRKLAHTVWKPPKPEIKTAAT